MEDCRGLHSLRAFPTKHGMALSLKDWDLMYASMRRSNIEPPLLGLETPLVCGHPPDLLGIRNPPREPSHEYDGA